MVRLNQKAKQILENYQLDFNSTMVRLNRDLCPQLDMQTLQISIPLWLD